MQQILDYLAANEMTPEQFAHGVNISVDAMYRYLRGERRPRWDVIARMKKFTNGAVTADGFLRLEDDVELAS